MQRNFSFSCYLQKKSLVVLSKAEDRFVECVSALCQDTSSQHDKIYDTRWHQHVPTIWRRCVEYLKLFDFLYIKKSKLATQDGTKKYYLQKVHNKRYQLFKMVEEMSKLTKCRSSLINHFLFLYICRVLNYVSTFFIDHSENCDLQKVCDHNP